MPWSNQSGGGGTGGGPWGKPGGNGGGGGPWGSGPQGGGNRPPDFEDIIRRGQDRLRTILPGGGGGGGASQIGTRGIVLIGLAAFFLWLATGFFIVRPNEAGIKLVFGRYWSTVGEGLSWNVPYPIGSVEKPLVTQNRTIEIGMRAEPGRRNPRTTDSESLMLTGDENIVDIDFTLQWQVDPAKVRDFVFNLENPAGTVRMVAESAMREVVGRRNIQTILTTERSAIEAEVQQLTQDTLNAYGAGVQILRVNLQRVDPPQQVIDAFRDVQAARQDQDRVRNEAETYASRVIPEARGESARIVQGAEAYRERSVAEAQGAASRFDQIYAEYRKAPDVIRERIFLETMERVLGGADKILLDSSGQAGGVVPYLPLNELNRRPAPTAPSAAANPGAVR